MPIYLDHAATTYIYPELIEVIKEDLEKFWGNPSTMYSFGQLSRGIIEDSRDRIAKSLGCDNTEIFFTAGSSEGNAFALNQRRKCLCSPYEHHDVSENVKAIIADDAYFQMALQSIEESGIDESYFANTLKDSYLFSHMYVNNETGEIFDIVEKANNAHNLGMLVHSDMTQALGNIHVNLHQLPIDIATFSGHKAHAPKFCGVIYFKQDAFKKEKIKPLIYGSQESTYRGGTENIPYIHAMSLAIEKSCQHIDEKNVHCKKLKLLLLEELAKNFKEDEYMIVSPANSVNSIIGICFKKIEGEVLQQLLSEKEIFIGTGAACSSGDMNPSAVLDYMKIPYEYIRGQIRISTDLTTTDKDIVKLVSGLKESYHMFF